MRRAFVGRFRDVHPPGPQDPAHAGWCWVTPLCGATTAAIGAAGCAAWWWGAGPLTRVLPGWPAMHATAAIALLVAGILLAGSRARHARGGLALAVTVLLLAFAALMLVQHLGVTLGVEVQVPGVRREVLLEGAPSVATTGALVACALGLLGRGWRVRSVPFPQVMGLFTFVVVYLAVAGNLLSLPMEGRPWGEPGMALATAVGLGSLALGLLFEEPRAAAAAALTSSTGGGLLLRRLLPATLVVPLLAGWFVVASRQAKGLDPAASAALAVLIVSVGGATFVIWNSRMLETMEAERARATEALARQAADLARERALARLKEQFFSTLSHELKTPLTLIVGNAELLADQHAGSAVAEGLMEGCRRLDAQLTRLLDYNALLDGTLNLYVTDLNADEVVEQAIAPQAAEAARKQLVLEVPPATLPPFQGDGRRLAGALGELVNNAVKFAAPGGRVTVLRGADADGVRFTVCGTGGGEADPAEGRMSLGIGLALAEGIATMHGGRLERPDPGNPVRCYGLVLPVAPVSQRLAPTKEVTP